MRHMLSRLVLVGIVFSVTRLSAQGTPNAMHPTFQVLDTNGSPAHLSGAEPSVERTCGTCHDVGFIEAHNSHQGPSWKATCLDCHYNGPGLPTDPQAFDEKGFLRRETIQISAARAPQCAKCHGILHLDPLPLQIPPDFETASLPRTYSLTRNTGAIWSLQDVSGAWLNLRDRDSRNYPWDIHARRLLDCTSCHFSKNNPTKGGLGKTPLDFLTSDPRHITLSQYLRRPNHELVTASCRSCHDPSKAHDFLPYKERHLMVLDCRSCHIPRLLGPALQAIDETVVTPLGGPIFEYRGLQDGAQAANLNTAFAEGFAPFLFEHVDPIEGKKIAPFNLFVRWFWVSRATGEEIEKDTVRAAWMVGDSYAPEVLQALDKNRDGHLEPAELRLDSQEKVALIAARLRALGVAEPEISGQIVAKPIGHGVVGGAQVRRDCANCHSANSVTNKPVLLSAFARGKPLPNLQAISGPLSQSGSLRFNITESGELVLERETTPWLYVFGLSRGAFANRLGLAIFGLVVAGVFVHAVLRVIASRKRSKPQSAYARQVYTYSAYERIWHWLMAFCVLMLLLTGLEIHFGDTWDFLGMPVAVKLHNFFAAVLVVNAFLSLFYHLASGAIRQFLPKRENLSGAVVAQARYYLRGIFLGQPPPVPKSHEAKLNPLQQITYLVLLNILFPFQMVTGILIWGASRWPDFADSIGGLRIVAPLHNFGSWLFLAFVVLHVYLTTTGKTLGAKIAAMVTGWEEVEEEQVKDGGAL